MEMVNDRGSLTTLLLATAGIAALAGIGLIGAVLLAKSRLQPRWKAGDELECYSDSQLVHYSIVKVVGTLSENMYYEVRINYSPETYWIPVTELDLMVCHKEDGVAKMFSRAYFRDGQCLVAVRYLGQWNDIRDFVQPDNPEVLAIYSQIGPDVWQCLDFVCRNISYRQDIGEFWQFPSETLRGAGDCEDSSILLTSLIRAGGIPACTALGGLQGLGHAWVVSEGEILEATYTTAKPVPDPEDYCPYVLFSDQEVIELWPGALGEVFDLRRNEAIKLNLMAKVLGGV